jgi:putative endonuclease
VYILKCRDGSLYTGITTDVKRRLAEHKNKTASHYTSAKVAVRMVYKEKHANRSAASKREAEIKHWKREKKLALITSGNNRAARSAVDAN